MSASTLPADGWASWYLETLDALTATIEAAEIEWETDSTGQPWVIAGDRITAIPDTPCALVYRFEKSRDSAESSPHAEYHGIEASLAVFIAGDPRDQRGNLREAIGAMGALEDALYADRSLGGTCRRLWITRATPFDTDAGGDSPRLAGAGLDVQINKTAETQP